MDSKIITILGVGGHGSSAYTELTTDPKYHDYQIHTVLGTDDSGGHTGVLQKVLPKMDLDIDSYKVLPMGDLKANIGRYLFTLTEDKDVAREKLDQMVSAYKGNDQEVFLAKCGDFCRTFDLTDSDFNKKFIDFCKKYLQVFLENETTEPNHKIGNLFLTFLFFKKKMNHSDFFAELKNLNFIPKQVFPHFIYSEALELNGANLDTGISFKSEQEVDAAKLPISPSSYNLTKYSDNKSLTVKDIQQNNPEVIDILKKSDLIVLSTGSIANLFGQLNVLAPLLRELDSTKVWLGNFARSSNEAEFVVLVTYYYSKQHLGLDGIVLQMSEAAFDNLTINSNDSTWVEKYRKQGKTFVNITDLMTSIKKVFDHNGLLKVTDLVQPVLGITAAAEKIADRIPGWNSLKSTKQEQYKTLLEQAGIKHVSSEVTLFIDFFYKLHLFLSSQVGIQQKDNRYQTISEILRKLNMDKKTILQNEIREYTEVLAGSNCREDFINSILKYNPDLTEVELEEILK